LISTLDGEKFKDKPQERKIFHFKLTFETWLSTCRAKFKRKVKLREALADYDGAVREGLKRRRLLVLCGVSHGKMNRVVLHLPDHILLESIFELAGFVSKGRLWLGKINSSRRVRKKIWTRE
jgi:hypothetical protein